MRRIISAVLAACFSLSLAVVALADTRVIVYPNQNPTSTEQNSNAQFARISVGSFERDALGLTGSINSTTGAYANLTISPGTGLFVTVAPTSTTVGAGTVYQMGQNDPNPLPTGGFSPALAASTTKILIAGQQTATTTPLGPLTAPGGGQSVYYLIETQLVSQDANSQSMAFVSSNGVKTFQSVNTNRNDAIVYQVKAGTPSGSPTQPTVDTGWIAVGYILVPNGKTQILTGDITMSPPLSGFVQNAAVVHVSAAASPTPDSGNAAVSGTLAGNQLVSKVATGTPPLIVSSTTQVPNLNAATAGTISPAPTPTAAAPITQAGTWPNLTYACATCVTSVTANGNLSSTGGTTPLVTMTAAPTFNNVTISNTTTLSALASGCLQVNGSGVISTTTCAAGSGVTSVSGTAPIVSSGGSTPAISCVTCVVLGPGSPQSGAISVTGSITSAAGLIGSSATLSGAATANSAILTPAAAPTASAVYIANDNGATNGIAINVPTGSTNGVRGFTAGVQKWQISNAGAASFVGVAAGGTITGATTVNASGLITGVGVTAGTGTVQGSSNASTVSFAPPVYTLAGAAVASTVHTALGSCSITVGTSPLSCTLSFSGAAVFSSATSYACSLTISVGSATTSGTVTGLVTNAITGSSAGAQESGLNIVSGSGVLVAACTGT